MFWCFVLAFLVFFYVLVSEALSFPLFLVFGGPRLVCCYSLALYAWPFDSCSRLLDAWPFDPPVVVVAVCLPVACTTTATAAAAATATLTTTGADRRQLPACTATPPTATTTATMPLLPVQASG